MTPITKICVICGNKIPETKNYRAKTCSSKCSRKLAAQTEKLGGNNKWYWDHRQHGLEWRRDYYDKHCRKRSRELDCVVCGEKVPNPRRNRIVCSEECKRIINRYHADVFVEKNKRICLEHYGGTPPKCACCGEFHYEFLSIDHIHGDGHILRGRYRLTGYQIYKDIIANNFPTDIYQILCFNCNFLKRDKDKLYCKVHHPELYPKDKNQYDKYRRRK